MFHAVNGSPVQIQRPPKQRGSIFYMTPAESELLCSISEGMPTAPSVVPNWKRLDNRVVGKNNWWYVAIWFVKTTWLVWRFTRDLLRWECECRYDSGACVSARACRCLFAWLCMHAMMHACGRACTLMRAYAFHMSNFSVRM